MDAINIWAVTGAVLGMVLVIFLGFGVFLMITYNDLVRLRNKVKNAIAQVDTQLRRREESRRRLSADVSLKHVQEELAEVEDKVTFARQFYNDAATIYNSRIQMFPGNLVAGIFGFREEALLEAEETAQESDSRLRAEP